MTTRQEYIDRFLSYLPQGDPDECWPWPKATDSNGYGMFSYMGAPVRTHVFAYEIEHGEGSARGKVIRHTCDNPPCCNQTHLIDGTHQQNTQDMLDRGRHWSPTLRGSANGNSKLTQKIVNRIRQRLSQGVSQRVIAKEFGISQTNVSDIHRRRTWN